MEEKNTERIYLRFCICFIDLFIASSFSADESLPYDNILKGVYVIDPANNINGIMDIAIKDSVIACVVENITASDTKRIFDEEGAVKNIY